jgi:DNA-binding transcriptional ArsR family regulator
MTNEAALEALGDGTRRRIMERLGGGPKAVGEIADGLPVTRPAVSQHLRVLREAGLVREHREGTRRIYEIEPAGIEQVWAYLQRFWGDVLGEFRTAAEAPMRKESER